MSTFEGGEVVVVEALTLYPTLVPTAKKQSNGTIERPPHWLSVKSGPGAPGREASQSRVGIMIVLCTYSNS